MRNLRNCLVALLLGCSAPVLVWVGAGVSLYQRRKEVSPLKQVFQDFACHIDTDCPPGFTCMGGRCVPVE